MTAFEQLVKEIDPQANVANTPDLTRTVVMGRVPRFNDPKIPQLMNLALENVLFINLAKDKIGEDIMYTIIFLLE